MKNASSFVKKQISKPPPKKIKKSDVASLTRKGGYKYCSGVAEDNHHLR
jgi:hypothetical protein